jgi:hypothetical protein
MTRKYIAAAVKSARPNETAKARSSKRSTSSAERAIPPTQSMRKKTRSRCRKSSM